MTMEECDKVEAALILRTAGCPPLNTGLHVERKNAEQHI